MHDFLEVGPEVAGALRGGRPVVALESTLVAHGMPFPDNLRCAREAESIVREQGAVPATVGLLGGRIRVGLADDQLERFASGDGIRKVSRRDLPATLASGLAGATTVAATLFCAHLAGIRVQVTGGIGGVHRGGQDSLDVSADLHELARTPVALVCSGAKAILDLGRTLEVLESLGVPVVGYRTDRFPAFYARDSGLGLEQRVDFPGEAAEVIRGASALGMPAGVLLVNPVPPEEALSTEEVEDLLSVALEDARERQVRGKALTPFLLDRLRVLSEGRTLRANRALVRDNARLGARIAAALAG
jgi:pseudouridine-5'-phosphate glycosidase